MTNPMSEDLSASPAVPRSHSFLDRLISLELDVAGLKALAAHARESELVPEPCLDDPFPPQDLPATPCDEPHLGMASNWEMIQELSTRYELGHTERDYRTVDE